jgi:hypothetical protein
MSFFLVARLYLKHPNHAVRGFTCFFPVYLFSVFFPVPIHLTFCGKYVLEFVLRSVVSSVILYIQTKPTPEGSCLDIMREHTYAHCVLDGKYAHLLVDMGMMK